jgi:hypothetical protein
VFVEIIIAAGYILCASSEMCNAEDWEISMEVHLVQLESLFVKFFSPPTFSFPLDSLWYIFQMLYKAQLDLQTTVADRIS